ncbi:MAG: metal-dependent hydrolase [Anaerolineae bacterium]|nr:metal-dependent hydrolase [Anaerolineae bacterium]MDW8172953.1 metal-dependent hydrolase [Anaerolineae bacterium]
MPVSYMWLAHSGIWFDVDGHHLLVDPFLTGNPLAPISADEIKAEVILLTHGHGDHLGDTIAIAQRTGATVVCNFEIGNWLMARGVTNVHQGNPGGWYRNDWMAAKFVQAFHSSSLPDGSYGGQPGGFIIQAGGKTFYHAGDTGLFGDMALFARYEIDIAFLPIGDTFTMGIDDSLEAARLLRPRYVAPLHYNTFPPIMQNAGAWAIRVNNETSAQPLVYDPGGFFIVD